jgi:CheY-like chemotaxis protein
MADSETARSTSRPRILLADDDSQVRKLFARNLVSQGYHVDEASDGKEALASLRAAKYDLLILDLSMPEADGFEVLRVLNTEMRDIKVLAISGYMDGAFLAAASFLGAMETLQKPAALDALGRAVKRLLAEP